VAFVAFELMRKQHPRLDLYEFLRLSPKEMTLPMESFRASIDRARSQLQLLRDQGKVMLSPKFDESTDRLIRYGLRNVGVYHSKRPLLLSQSGQVITKSLKTLFYYRNRLEGYDLDKFI
jgi:glycerol-3-phosphate O-acyltransferase